MSHYQTMSDAVEAIRILRRVLAGEEFAKLEGQQLIEKIDKRHAKEVEERKAKQAQREKRAKSGRMNSGNFEILPQVTNGVDHGSKAMVLMRKGMTRLVWQPGSMYFGGVGRRNYAPAELEIRTEYGNAARELPIRLTDHFHAGRKAERLTPKLIMKHAAKIDYIFGKDAAGKASRLEKTVVLDVIKLGKKK